MTNDESEALSTDDEREALDRAVREVTWNASNYPRKAQPHILGADIGPLTKRIVDSVEAAGFRRPVQGSGNSAQNSDHERELLAEADALVEQWDRKGSWTPDSPVGLVMRLVDAIRRPVRGEPTLTESQARAVTTAHAIAQSTGMTVSQVVETVNSIGWQGEPTDAQVLAAVDAFMVSQMESQDGPAFVHRNMAAALRAAFQEGENRG